MQRRLQIFNKEQITQKDQTHFLTDLLKDLFADKPSRQIQKDILTDYYQHGRLLFTSMTDHYSLACGEKSEITF